MAGIRPLAAAPSPVAPTQNGQNADELSVVEETARRMRQRERKVEVVGKMQASHLAMLDSMMDALRLGVPGLPRAVLAPLEQAKDWNFFVCEPAQGTLAPGARVQVQVTFTPTSERAYTVKIPFKLNNNPRARRSNQQHRSEMDRRRSVRNGDTDPVQAPAAAAPPAIVVEPCFQPICRSASPHASRSSFFRRLGSRTSRA